MAYGCLGDVLTRWVVDGAERGIGVNGMRIRRGLCADAGVVDGAG